MYYYYYYYYYLFFLFTHPYYLYKNILSVSYNQGPYCDKVVIFQSRKVDNKRLKFFKLKIQL
jgi:hypothetical protein